MLAIKFDAPGDPDVLHLADMAMPEPGPDQVLVKTIASGINKPDIMQRRGLYPPPPDASPLLGLEISGQIVAVGNAVKTFSVGDTICALTHGGGYASHVAVDAAHCLPIPEGVDPVDAAGLPETFFTVWSNFFLDQQPKPGSRFLVHGGAGGIGSTAIQLGKAFGLEVFTTCRGEEAKTYCKSLGAREVIDYKDEDFVAVLAEAGGADLILDMIGGDYVARNLKAACEFGRIVQLAFSQGSRVEVDLMLIMLKKLVLTGSTLRSRPSTFKARIAASLEDQVWPRIADGTIRTVTHAVYRPEDCVAAHRDLEAGGHFGKLIIRWPQ